MADQTLSPALRQTAEQYLGRPLEAQEEQQLLLLQQNIQSQQPALSGAVQQARQQAQRTISLGQSRATSSVRDLLEAIQQSSSKALQVQEAEEQAILKLLEGSQSLAELRPSALQPGMAGLRPGSQLALSQIAEHLSNLARQEVEKCFQQSFGPLIQQLQTLAERLDAGQAGADGQAASSSEPPSPAVDAPSPPAAATEAVQTSDGVHADPGPASMQ
ncbi:hypothetical protein [Chromobacterium phragmitis]|uniref:Uncharacterized protein n=2 Tax=Chromobacterium phragmitis TaxID=2202141 RepID=A0A344UHR9_9NEIS|nr:hypothetical protein [Chromobacterium phragmitis]AXE34817.1 hypothetical protein DK843_11250 [Chromobacterium phragmitis]